MKRTTIVGLILGVGFVLFCGLCLVIGFFYVVGSRHNRTQAIVEVINETGRDLRELKAITDSHPADIDKVHATTVAMPALIAKIRSIDISKCPADFQQAHLRYRQALEAFMSRLEQFPQTKGAILSQALFGGAALTKSNDKVQDEADAVRSAWDTVESTALKYGVTVR